MWKRLPGFIVHRSIRTTHIALQYINNARPLTIVMNSVSCVSNRSNYRREKCTTKSSCRTVVIFFSFSLGAPEKKKKPIPIESLQSWEVNLFGSLIWHLWNEMKEGKVPQDYRWVFDKWTHTTSKTFVFFSSSSSSSTSFFFCSFFSTTEQSIALEKKRRSLRAPWWHSTRKSVKLLLLLL